MLGVQQLVSFDSVDDCVKLLKDEYVTGNKLLTFNTLKDLRRHLTTGLTADINRLM